MSKKEKSLTGEFCNNSRPRSGKFQLENFTILHVCEVEKFNRWILGYILSTKWNRLTGELEDISCPRSEKLAGELCNISCPRSGKVSLEKSAIFYGHELEKFNLRPLRYFMSTKRKILTGEVYYISCLRSGKF